MTFCWPGSDGRVHHHAQTCRCKNPLITYTIPLRPTTNVRLDAPPDLTKAETERLSAFIKTLNTETDV